MSSTAGPISNLALVVGWFLGLLLVSSLPMLMVVLVVQLFGWSSRAVGWWLGEPVEPVAQTAFLVVDALPILAFWIALVLRWLRSFAIACSSWWWLWGC